jgi:5-methylcytosine-specific restriction endonuclease McrA
MTTSVFVLYQNLAPAMMCTPKRATQLLNAGKAAVYRRVPFTIILKQTFDGIAQPITLKFDPGSKTTGIVLTINNVVVFAANLEHRGETVRRSLISRKGQRSGRRSRHVRHRAPSLKNKKRQPKGSRTPSIKSRIDNIVSWTKRLMAIAPITLIEFENVRFDTQKMQNPEISGIEYQQGTLLGYELREYLMQKFSNTCAYCDKTDTPLEIEHVIAKANGGSDRVSNLTIACHVCNQAKGVQDIRNFVLDKTRLAAILVQLKTPLKDTGVMNSMRFAIGNALKATGIPVQFWSGGRTKMNRVAQKYPKDHWIDAACVGESGAYVKIDEIRKPLIIKAIGRGNRQMCLSNKYGFPRTGPKTVKRVNGFQAGDMVKLVLPKGKYAGTYTGTVAVRASKIFDLKNPGQTISANAKYFTLIQRTNGYAFSV